MAEQYATGFLVFATFLIIMLSQVAAHGCARTRCAQFQDHLAEQRVDPGEPHAAQSARMVLAESVFNSGDEVFAVLDGVVDMHYRVAGIEHIATLGAGGGVSSDLGPVLLR